MKISSVSYVLPWLASLVLAYSSTPLALGAHAAEKASTRSAPPVSQALAQQQQEPSGVKGEESAELAAVIAPWRSAEISAEVRGIIESLDFKEGDFVEKDRVVVAISKRRAALVLQRATNAVRASEVDLKRVRQEAQLKEQLLSNKAATTIDVLKAKADEEIAHYRLEEAQNTLELARIDVESCLVKAPFSGYVALRFKEPFESVDYLQKLFVIVDTSKVYAIAAVAESYLSHVTKGTRMAFIPSLSLGKEVRLVGTVERVAKLSDPKSGTRKVYVLIDNPDGRLEVGMTGSLELEK